MTKKAQFIIPTILIKESNLIKEANLINAAGKGIHAATSAMKTTGGPGMVGKFLNFFRKKPNSLINTASSTGQSAAIRNLPQGQGLSFAGVNSSPTPFIPGATARATTNTIGTGGNVITSSPTDSMGRMISSKFGNLLNSKYGKYLPAVATGAAGYGFGNSRGYDEGFGQGSLSAQQMAAIQAMQAQQQARQMYDNQGFLDRLTGRNPF